MESGCILIFVFCCVQLGCCVWCSDMGQGSFETTLESPAMKKGSFGAAFHGDRFLQCRWHQAFIHC